MLRDEHRDMQARLTALTKYVQRDRQESLYRPRHPPAEAPLTRAKQHPSWVNRFCLGKESNTQSFQRSVSSARSLAVVPPH